MKNFILSPRKTPDLKNFSVKLELIQTELRHQRDDNIYIRQQLTILVKGLAILVSQPEPEPELPELEDK